MPAKNSIKLYVDDGIYHVYNRGVEKREIFLDRQDYAVFLRFLKDALTALPDPKNLQVDVSLKGQTFKGKTFKGIPKLPKNFYGNVELLAYCLMPNHFHLLVKHRQSQHLKQFMQALMTRYTIYFNSKHKRIGGLFQGRYKGIMVTEESYLLHLTRYIHRNPLEISDDLINAYSSYGEYLGVRKTPWINTKLILSFFQPATLPILRHTNTYRSFVESTNEDSESFLGDIVLEDTL